VFFFSFLPCGCLHSGIYLGLSVGFRNSQGSEDEEHSEIFAFCLVFSFLQHEVVME
jgi:hypothetical protein